MSPMLGVLVVLLAAALGMFAHKILRAVPLFRSTFLAAEYHSEGPFECSLDKLQDMVADKSFPVVLVHHLRPVLERTELRIRTNLFASTIFTIFVYLAYWISVSEGKYSKGLSIAFRSVPLIGLLISIAVLFVTVYEIYSQCSSYRRAILRAGGSRQATSSSTSQPTNS